MLRRAIDNVQCATPVRLYRRAHPTWRSRCSADAAAPPATRRSDHACATVGPGAPRERPAPTLCSDSTGWPTPATRQTGGTGIGLAITERAVLLNHGRVTAANAPDGGLIVEIVLPH